MNGFDQAAAALIARNATGRTLPETRKIELYTNTLELKLYDPENTAPSPWNIPEVMAALCAFAMLDLHLEAAHPDLARLDTRARFQTLPLDTRTRRLTAQVYRILKILRRGATAPGSRVQTAERVFQVNYVEAPFAFGLRITLAGLDLLAGFVSLYLDAPRLPHSEAYVEALLAQFYEDIIAEIRYLSDEDGSVLHFRKKHPFNRHFRFQCCTARFTLEPEHIRIDTGERFADKYVYPVDFFLFIEGEYHIIPCEVLADGRLPRAELPLWKVRQPDPGAGAPAYNLRLVSEGISPGPMG